MKENLQVGGSEVHQKSREKEKQSRISWKGTTEGLPSECEPKEKLDRPLDPLINQRRLITINYAPFAVEFTYIVFVNDLE